jgi:prepilin-type processing-associated H-X9-DG protein
MKNSGSPGGELFNWPRSQASLRRPSQTMMVSEKGGGGGTTCILSWSYYMMRDSHSEGGNVGFVDGHVSWYRFLRGNIGNGWENCQAGYEAYNCHAPWETFGQWYLP